MFRIYHGFLEACRPTYTSLALDPGACHSVIGAERHRALRRGSGHAFHSNVLAPLGLRSP